MIPCRAPEVEVFTYERVQKPTYCGVSGVGEAGRTSELYLCSRNLPTHSYTCIRDQFKLWWDFDAPDPRCGETLHLLEKKSNLSIYPFDRRREGVDA